MALVEYNHHMALVEYNHQMALIVFPLKMKEALASMFVLFKGKETFVQS